MQIACGNRKSTSCSKINRAILKSESFFSTKQFPCQYQAAINSCKQSFVDTQHKIKTQTNKINRFAMYLTCFGCPGASNKAKIKVNTHRSPCFIFLLSIQSRSISGGDDRRCIRSVICIVALFLYVNGKTKEKHGTSGRFAMMCHASLPSFTFY